MDFSVEKGTASESCSRRHSSWAGTCNSGFPEGSEFKLSSPTYTLKNPGATTGSIGAALANPVDLVRVRLQEGRGKDRLVQGVGFRV